MTAPGLVIAHRAAESPGALARAVAHADVAEIDVHLFRGRLEVRHAKTLGPFPRLWERWYLLDRDAPRPGLAQVLAAVPPGLGVLLDLKGPDPRLGPAVLAAAADRIAAGGVYVSARVWPTVDRLRGVPGVRTLRTVGGPLALRALLRRASPGSLEGVSVRRDLLTPAVAAALRERADDLWTWPVDDPETAAVLSSWGATGFISDAPERLRPRSGG